MNDHDEAHLFDGPFYGEGDMSMGKSLRNQVEFELGEPLDTGFTAKILHGIDGASVGLVMAPSVNPVDAAVVRRLREQQEEAKKAELEAEVQQRLAWIKAFGEDIYEDGDVIRFTKMLGDRSYTYAAVKAGAYWYTTGIVTKPARRSWQGLLLFMISGDRPTLRFEVMEFRFTVGTEPQPRVRAEAGAKGQTLLDQREQIERNALADAGFLGEPLSMEAQDDLAELRAHLRYVHRNEAAGELTPIEALRQHAAEHFGPGGLRLHDHPTHLAPNATLHEGEPR